MLKTSIERGNHRSALSNKDRPVVTKLMSQDVKLGYNISLIVKSIRWSEQIRPQRAFEQNTRLEALGAR